nr:FCD domain-containing protein [Fodinicola feengrottensis]
MEPGAARLAAVRRTDQDLARLDAGLTQMSAAADPAAAVVADLAFHRLLLATTHNELLVRMEVVIETGLAERDRIVHGVLAADDPVPSHTAPSSTPSAPKTPTGPPSQWRNSCSRRSPTWPRPGNCPLFAEGEG